VPPRNLDSRATIQIGDQTFDIDADSLEKICDLGRGAYGIVEKMRHRQTDTVLAVKRIPMTVNIREQHRLVMDLDISMRSSDCPYTVHFYGAMNAGGSGADHRMGSPLERGIAVGTQTVVLDALKPIGHIYFGYFVGPNEGLGQKLWILGSVLMVLCEAASEKDSLLNGFLCKCGR